MTAFVVLPKWFLRQFLVNRCLYCKKQCHSWLHWARQEPKAWRLRNLLGNLPRKKKKFHFSNPPWKDLSLLVSSADPGCQSWKLLSALCVGKDTARAGSTVLLSFLLPIPDASCLQQPLRVDTWLRQQQTSLEWARRANLPLFVKRAIWNTIQRDLKKGFDLSFHKRTRRCCQHRLFSMISRIDAPARSTVLAVLVHICHRHLLFVGMSVCYKKTRFNGKKKASPALQSFKFILRFFVLVFFFRILIIGYSHVDTKLIQNTACSKGSFSPFVLFYL